MRRRWIYPAVGEPYEVEVSHVSTPRSAYVRGDIQPYQSMVTGELITSRSHHREHLKQHGKVEIGNESVSAPVQKRDDSLKRDLHQVFTGYGH